MRSCTPILFLEHRLSIAVGVLFWQSATKSQSDRIEKPNSQHNGIETEIEISYLDLDSVYSIAEPVYCYITRLSRNQRCSYVKGWT